MADCDWCSPPPDLSLATEEVHVWRASLEQPAAHLHELAQILSADEQTRAERFHFERDRRRFIVGRGVLRTILGHYLGVEPHRLRFAYGLRGKPYLAETCGRMVPRFNLAHSHELALYAVACGREVGVDVEYVHPVPDAEQIAARFFSARESAALCLLPAEQREEGFFRCWTRKEAYIKAIGDGLAQPLDQFDVPLAREQEPQLLDVGKSSAADTPWFLEAFIPARGYVAALAVEGNGWHSLRWQYGWWR